MVLKGKTFIKTEAQIPRGRNFFLSTIKSDGELLEKRRDISRGFKWRALSIYKDCATCDAEKEILPTVREMLPS